MSSIPELDPQLTTAVLMADITGWPLAVLSRERESRVSNISNANLKLLTPNIIVVTDGSNSPRAILSRMEGGIVNLSGTSYVSTRGM